MDQEVRRWAQRVGQQRPEVRLIGYFGSLARGDWGVGSDLDLVIVVEHSELPFERRPVEWDTTGLLVPVDLLVYTREEWEALGRQGRFRGIATREAVWLYENP